MKLIHGHMFFAKEEGALLNDWLRGLTDAQKAAWKKYICRIHHAARMKNIRGYENSCLKETLTD